MYNINNTFRTVVIPRDVYIFDTGMKAISNFYELKITPAVGEYSTFVSGQGTIAIRFEKKTELSQSYDIERITDLREAILHSESDGVTALKHYLQKLQDEAANKNVINLMSQVLSVAVRSFLDIALAALRFFRFDHHSSNQRSSKYKQPKFDIVTGDAQSNAEVTTLNRGITSEGIDSLETYHTFYEDQHQYIHDRDSGLSLAINKSWQKPRNRFTPIRKIEINAQGELYLELYKFAYNPLKEGRNIIKQFTNDVKNGIINVGWYTANIRDINENYGLVSFKANIPVYSNYTANLALTLNGQPIALEVEIVRSRS